ncbi:hypothetical protein [Streptosporangium sp. CA-115845]|uniref:hypothetical protein n=1 Tax=Streptosporangium sp. CA-115845 TaxID=3240071 RepID=UPI003D9004CF
MVEETEGIRLVKEPGEAGHPAGFFGLDGTGEQGRTTPARRLDVRSTTPAPARVRANPGCCSPWPG